MVSGRGSGLTCLATSLTRTLIVIALATGLVFGQGFSAAISGIVRDTTGAVLPGVSVTVKHLESGLTRTAVSSENGGYNMQLLPVGPYELTTDLPGFKQQVRRGITLVVGQEAVVNLTLEVGAVAEKVTVTEEAHVILEGLVAKGLSLVDDRELERLRAVEAAALTGGVTTEGLREAAEYALGFMNDPEGLAHKRKEWCDKLRAALSTTPPAPEEHPK